MKICFLFPGYGSQFVGMGKDLYDESRIVQEYFEQASHCLEMNFVKLSFASSDIELARVENALPALFLLSSSLFSLLKNEGIVPDVVVGFNNGEYAALYAAQGINFPDGLYMLKKYTAFYQELLTTVDVRMVMISGLRSLAIKKVCEQVRSDDAQVEIAFVIQEKQIIVSGHAIAVDLFYDHIMNLEDKDIAIEYIDTAFGLHSQLMNTVVKSCATYIPVIDINDLSIPMIRGMDAKVITNKLDVQKVLLNSSEHVVQWKKVVDKLVSYDLFVVVGPSEFLNNLIKTVYPDKLSIGINSRADIEKLKLLIQEKTMNGELSDGV